jgi:hypothetical protein
LAQLLSWFGHTAKIIDKIRGLISYSPIEERSLACILKCALSFILSHPLIHLISKYAKTCKICGTDLTGHERFIMDEEICTTCDIALCWKADLQNYEDERIEKTWFGTV